LEVGSAELLPNMVNSNDTGGDPLIQPP
jgi:hypothetical protein